MAKNPPRKGLRRRDATGHLDPQYAADLLDQSRANRDSDPPEVFVDETEDDRLATQLAVDFVQSATSAEDGDVDEGDELIRDEPFVPDGDDDDLSFEPEELMFPTPRPRHTEAEPTPARKPARKAAKPKAAKAKAAPKAKTGSASKTKAVKTKAKAVKTKAKAKAVKVKTKAKAVKSKKSAPARKTAKKKPARKAAKRRR